MRTSEEYGKYTNVQVRADRPRLSDSTPKSYTKSASSDGEQLYFYPPGNENPSPMYEGLCTNLPYVR